MSEFVSGLSSAWAATSNIEIVAVMFGLLYIILAARENSWCWPAAFIGTGTSIYLFWDGELLMESALNVYYLAMAVFGWWQWQYGGKEDGGGEKKWLPTEPKHERCTAVSRFIHNMVCGYHHLDGRA